MSDTSMKDAIAVPASAVFRTDDGGSYVLVAGSDNVAHQKTVQVGIRSDTTAQILSGVNAGDAIIISGGYALPDKTKIKIEAPGTEEGKDAGGADKDEKDDKAADPKKPDNKDKD